VNLMLTALFLFLAVGLLSPRLGRWQQIAIVVIATTMTMLYYVRGERFM
jgi:hypothetical protein